MSRIDAETRWTRSLEVTLEQFGAVGFTDVDNMNANNVATAMQAAADYLRDNGGGTIRIPAKGYYWANNSMVDLWAGVNIKAEHGAISVNMTDAGGSNTPASPIPVVGTVFYCPGPIFNFFRLYGGNKLEGFTVDKTVDIGGRAGDTTDAFTGGRVFDVTNSSGVVIEDVTVHRAYDVIYVDTVSPAILNGIVNGLRVRNLNVCRYEHIGTYLRGVVDVSIENGSWYARDNMMSVHPYAIWVENFAATIDFVRVGWLGGKGLRLHGGTAYYDRIFDIHFIHCCVDSMLGDAPSVGQGIYIGNYVADVWFEKCWIGTSNVAFRITGYNNNIDIDGCAFLNHTYSPIIVDDGNPVGLKVRGCTFYANNLSGTVGQAAAIKVSAGAKKFSIQGNVIGNVGDYTGLGPGLATEAVIVGEGASDYYDISGNITNGLAVTDGGSGTHKSVQSAR